MSNNTLMSFQYISIWMKFVWLPLQLGEKSRKYFSSLQKQVFNFHNHII